MSAAKKQPNIIQQIVEKAADFPVYNYDDEDDADHRSKKKYIYKTKIFIKTPYETREYLQKSFEFTEEYIVKSLKNLKKINRDAISASIDVYFISTTYYSFEIENIDEILSSCIVVKKEPKIFEKSCPICLDTRFVKPRQWQIFSCGHSIHKNCAIEMRRNVGIKTCPTCRADV